jgi:hypothetical protein
LKSFEKFSSTWRTVKTWTSPKVNFRVFAFPNTHTHNLHPTINTLSESISFTDDTCVMISSKNFDHFSTMSNTVLSHMSKWFTANKFVLNPDKTNIILSITNKSRQYDLNIGYDEKYIEESINTKSLSLQIDNHLIWKNNDS